MTYRGHVENGVILLDGEIRLPDGAIVRVTLDSAALPGPAAAEKNGPTMEEKLAAIWADVPATEWARIPIDLTDHLDHYLYGTPKQ